MARAYLSKPASAACTVFLALPENSLDMISAGDAFPTTKLRDTELPEDDFARSEPSQPTSPKPEQWSLPTVKEADPLSLSMGSSGGLIAWSKGLQPDALSPQASLACFFPST
eukprot:s3515_g4.t1